MVERISSLPIRGDGLLASDKLPGEKTQCDKLIDTANHIFREILPRHGYAVHDRQEDETPFIVQWFINNGIEVWSTVEGQQKIEQHVDKLLNYTRFWQAQGESEKTSVRVKTAHAQITRDGHFRGGTVPFGYKLEDQGRVNKKGNPLGDLAIDEREGAVIKSIFDLYYERKEVSS